MDSEDRDCKVPQTELQTATELESETVHGLANITTKT